jgi:tetratricopeptide (TPR) repeat protein
MKFPLLKACFGSALIWLALGLTSVAQTPQSNQSSALIESRELNARVIKLYAEQKYDEALPLARRALELREAELGANHQDLIPLLLNLGELYRATQKPNDARSFYQRALQISESAFGVDDLRVAKVLDKLAYLEFGEREYDKSEHLFLRSLAIRERALGAENPDVAETAFALGETYRYHREYAKAEARYQQAIHVWEKSAKKDDAQLLKALNGYQLALLGQNKTVEAEQVQKRRAELSAEPGVVEGGVLNGTAIKLVQPGYPPLAPRVYYLSVPVRVLIDETGKVISAQVIGQPPPAFRAAAEDAARHSKFTPTLVNGVPVKVNGTIIYNFGAR